MKDLAVIILAAGKSTRMKSKMPKVLHPLCGRPVLAYVLDLVGKLRPQKTVAVLGFKSEEVLKILPPGVDSVIQKKLVGTADAVKCAMPKLRDFKGTVLVLYGDTPLLKKETIDKLLKNHRDNNPAATLLTAHLDTPAAYGRILRDKYNGICGIIEKKDANDFQKDIKEINTGIICFSRAGLDFALKRIQPHNRKKEYYLTDAVGILYKNERLIDGVRLADMSEALGINSRSELAQSQSIMQSRINENIMNSGVTIVNPAATFIDYGVKIGRDTVIYPFTVIESRVIIGNRCSVGPLAHLKAGTRMADATIWRGNHE